MSIIVVFKVLSHNQRCTCIIRADRRGTQHNSCFQPVQGLPAVPRSPLAWSRGEAALPPLLPPGRNQPQEKPSEDCSAVRGQLGSVSRQSKCEEFILHAR